MWSAPSADSEFHSCMARWGWKSWKIWSGKMFPITKDERWIRGIFPGSQWGYKNYLDPGAQVGIRESLRGAYHFLLPPGWTPEPLLHTLKCKYSGINRLSADFTVVTSDIQSLSEGKKNPCSCVILNVCIYLNTEISKVYFASHSSSYRHVAKASKTLLPWPGRSNLIVKCFAYLTMLILFHFLLHSCYVLNQRTWTWINHSQQKLLRCKTEAI